MMAYENPELQKKSENPLTKEEMDELGVEEGDESYFFKAPVYNDKGEQIVDSQGNPVFRSYHFMKIMDKKELKKAILEEKKKLGLI